jgi:hypothetical protein
MLVSAIGEHGEYETQRIRASLETRGAPVLNGAQLAELVGAPARIQAHFEMALGKTNDATFAMDVEWKLLPAGHIQVKHARPVV